MSKKNIFTKEGFEKLKNELEKLKTVTRLEIATKLSEATEFGDLSENAAYHSAMEMRDMNETKIAELEEILGNAKVVKGTPASKDIIAMGSKVVLESNTGTKLEFEIVGTGETDLINKKFNIDSPLATSVVGKKKGDKAIVSLPSGKVEYTVISVK